MYKSLDIVISWEKSQDVSGCSLTVKAASKEQSFAVTARRDIDCLPIGLQTTVGAQDGKQLW